MLSMSTLDFQIVFEAIKGKTYLGDMAIDDITILDKACPPPGSCDFEEDSCTWTNVQSGDDFDWTRLNGATGSQLSGPSNDHTEGNLNGEAMLHKVMLYFVINIMDTLLPCQSHGGTVSTIF